MVESHIVEEDLEKDPRRRLLEVLRILASFYSFRKLEEKLGFPMQMLWKYYTLKSIPEKETALKILQKIRETKILEEMLSEIVQKSVEPASLLGNIGVLELAAYEASEIAKQDKVSAVLSLPDPYSAVVAFMTAIYARTGLCLSDYVYTEQDSTCTVLRNGCIVRPLCVSRKCLAKKNLLLVESVYIPGSILDIYELVERHGSSIASVYILYGDPLEVNEEIKALEEQPHVKILVAKNSKGVYNNKKSRNTS